MWKVTFKARKQGREQFNVLKNKKICAMIRKKNRKNSKQFKDQCEKNIFYTKI